MAQATCRRRRGKRRLWPKCDHVVVVCALLYSYVLAHAEAFLYSPRPVLGAIRLPCTRDRALRAANQGRGSKSMSGGNNSDVGASKPSRVSKRSQSPAPKTVPSAPPKTGKPLSSSSPAAPATARIKRQPTKASPPSSSSSQHSPSSRSSSAPPGSPPSRTSASPRLGMDWAWSLAAQRRLPSLETPYPPIPTTQLLAWEREGHTLTRSLCTSEELKDYAKVVRAAFEREKLAAFRQKVRVLLGPEAFEDCQTLEECEEVMEEYVDPDAVPFLQTFNGWRQFQDVRRLALAKRFARVAAELLNVPRVRLYQDSTFLKRVGDGPTLWHSDLSMAPFHTNEAVTMWLPLTPIPPEDEGGTGLLFASGSHRDFALSFWEDAKGGGRRDLEGRYALDSYGRMEVGDATWHHGWCLHSSGPNDLEEDRMAFTLCFVADGAEMLEGGEGKLGGGRGPDDEDEESYRDWRGKVGRRVGEKEHVYLPLVWDEAWGSTDTRQEGGTGEA